MYRCHCGFNENCTDELEIDRCDDRIIFFAKNDKGKDDLIHSTIATVYLDAAQIVDLIGVLRAYLIRMTESD